MKVAVFTVENSSDVQLAVEMIKAMDAQVVCSPKEALMDPVVTHYQKQQEKPVEAMETPSIADKQAEEEELLIKQAAEEKKAKAAAKLKEMEAKAEEEAKAAKAEEEAKAAKAEEEAKAAKAEEEAKAAKAAKAAEYEKRTQRVEDSGVSYEMIRIKATKRVKEGVLTREGLIELLAKYKAKSLSQVKESDYGQLYNDLD